MEDNSGNNWASYFKILIAGTNFVINSNDLGIGLLNIENSTFGNSRVSNFNSNNFMMTIQ